MASTDRALRLRPLTRLARTAALAAVAVCVAAVAGITVATTAAPAAAQSITAVRGLGYPTLPTDARTQALGGLGVGLQGLSVPLLNPASMAGITRRGFILAAETAERDLTVGDATGEAGGTRFPLLKLLIPVRSAVLSLGYGSYLDQAWAIQRSGVLSVGSGSVPFDDVIESSGGIGQLQLGVAVPLGEDIAVGASIGAYTGNQRVRYVRHFDTLAVAGFAPFDETSGWRYFGPTATIGARADLGDVSRIGLSVTWSGAIEADSIEGRAQSREIELPLQVAGGASAYLARSLLATVSARWSGWSVYEPDPAAPIAQPAVGGGRDTWEIGGGIELDDPASRESRHFPIRLGVQYRQLPFSFGAEAPTELFYGGGVGLRVGTDPQNPIAMVDLAVQRGTRTVDGGEIGLDIEESAWRFALSLSLFAN